MKSKPLIFTLILYYALASLVVNHQLKPQEPPAAPAPTPASQHRRHLRPPHAHRRARAPPLAAQPPAARARRHHAHAPGSFLDASAAAQAERPLVATGKGLVRGSTRKLPTGKFVDAFLGIPYAQPPLGRYRFRHPQPAQSWAGELDASRMANSCLQVNDTFFGENFAGTNVWNANTPLHEDCLYLNVWSPFGVANTSGAPAASARAHQAPGRPVLVWIFGGGFTSGTASLGLYEGGTLASEEDVVVVSMNYRVSALGFLYFGQPEAPGNAGLFDQLLALQWVQDNVGQFGGDPARVTIFGESSGAVSVAYHLLSPLSRNLFGQAILQSGAATCPWGSMETREIRANGLQLARLLGCPANSSELDQTIECLLRADAKDIVYKTLNVGRPKSVLNFPFVPVVDGSFLIEQPHESLNRSNFKPARLLLGSNHDEGNSWLIYLPEFSHCPSGGGVGGGGSSGAPTQRPPLVPSAPPEEPDGFGESLPLVAPRELAPLESLSLLGSSERQRAAAAAAGPAPNQNQSAGSQDPCRPNEFVSFSREDFVRELNEDVNPLAASPVGKEAIVFEYSNWLNPADSISNYDALDKIVGDYYFTCSVNEFARKYSEAGNAVFMYYFKQRSSTSPWPKWMGVLHGDEISYVFGEPLNPALNYTDKEVELSRRIMRYWANFAKTGDPTRPGEGAPMSEKWPDYADRRQYFELHADYIRLGRGPRAKQCAFWSHYLPNLIESFGECAEPEASDARHRQPANCRPDRSQCSAHQTSARLPDGRIHPPDERRTSARPLSSIPSPTLLGALVILIIMIVGLLIYANKSGKLDLNFGLSSGGAPANSNANEQSA